VEEEVVLLEEQLTAAQADIARLQELLSTAEMRAVARDEEVLALQRQVEATRGEVTAAAERERLAAGRYRELILLHEPSLPAELVSGETIDALDAAVLQARQTVAQVRQHLEQQAQALRVPAGSPVRGEPDLSDLSPGEKIRAGLRQS
jgi:hypothetical protein